MFNKELLARSAQRSTLFYARVRNDFNKSVRLTVELGRWPSGGGGLVYTAIFEKSISPGEIVHFKLDLASPEVKSSYKIRFCAHYDNCDYSEIDIDGPKEWFGDFFDSGIGTNKFTSVDEYINELINAPGLDQGYLWIIKKNPNYYP